MSPFDEHTMCHIQTSVVSHGFADSRDWSLGLEELSMLSDSDIDTLVTDPSSRLPAGITPEIARRDRELFDRVTVNTERKA